jgi:type I site-specific restriction endonuclease
MAPSPESLTRKSRIDPKLDARGWRRVKAPSPAGACRTEEHPTAHGPADYVLFLDGQPVAIVEAKKTAVDPQNVLTQAERYARGLADSHHDFDGIRVPFLYSTNGEQIWFRDVRNPDNRSRRVADFHAAGHGHRHRQDLHPGQPDLPPHEGRRRPPRALPRRPPRLAAQAVRAFKSFEPEPALKFDQIYELYSQALPARGFRRGREVRPHRPPPPTT